MINTKELLSKVKEQYGFDVTYNQLRKWIWNGLIVRPIKRGRGLGKGMIGTYPDDTVIEVATIYWLNIKLHITAPVLQHVKQILSNRKSLDPHIRVLMGQTETDPIDPRVLHGLSRYLIIRTAFEQGYKPSQACAWKARFHFHVESKGQNTQWDVKVELNPVPVNEPIMVIG